MTRRRPFGITLLAILAALAGVVAATHTLQYLHIMPVWIGNVAFWGFDLWGAVLWGIATALYAWIVAMLWTVQPAGWLYLVLISGWNLIMVVLSAIGPQSSLSAFVPALVINGIVLIYCLLPSTKRAFGPPIAI
jgi:hypothetical protein